MLRDSSTPISHARHPDDPATLAIAGVITESLRIERLPLIRGLSEGCFQKLLHEYFEDLAYANGNAAPHEARHNGLAAYDEFDEIVELLLEHRASNREQETWLAYAIATASMGNKHLWQDLGLPSRSVLSALMTTHFPSLAAKNRGDMKWKKFFYRQLCERAGVPICKSPHCADCCDYRLCFGPEES
jgi:nitrogen fixation protein NifQ